MIHNIHKHTKPKHLQGLVKDMPSTRPQKKYGVDELSGLKMQLFNVTQTARPFLMSYVLKLRLNVSCRLCIMNQMANSSRGH